MIINYICTKCNCSRKRHRYLAAMRNGAIDLVCNSCRNKSRKHLCEGCNKEKDYQSFTSMMMNYGATPLCAMCDPDRQNKKEYIKRSCLKCSKEFETSNKFIRRCDYCKKKDSSKCYDQYGGVEL